MAGVMLKATGSKDGNLHRRGVQFAKEEEESWQNIKISGVFLK